MTEIKNEKLHFRVCKTGQNMTASDMISHW